MAQGGLGFYVNNGQPTAFATSGIDMRQQYATIGNKHFGTFKFGRDIGLFAQEAILNDFTILAVGTTNGNVAPGSVSLGRIGLGYIYTDFSTTDQLFNAFYGRIHGRLWRLPTVPDLFTPK